MQLRLEWSMSFDKPDLTRLYSEDDFLLGSLKVRQQSQFFSELPSLGSHNHTIRI